MFPPTTEQAAILAAAPGDDNLMIEALAGTGKTTTLEMLVPLLQAPSILALAFNVKIRDELTKRLQAPGLLIKTLNGLGNQVWFNHIRKYPQVAGNKTYNLIKDYESSQRVRFSKDETQDLQSMVRAAKVLGFVPNGLAISGRPLLRDTPESIEDIFDWAEVDPKPDLAVAFRAIMQASILEALRGTRIDFDDQIYMPVIFQASFPHYHTILVDEAQDLSHMNQLMIEACKPKRVIAVGDRHQAIYAFRGALSNSMDALEVHRPYLHLPLSTTFRCGKAIVERAQGYVPSYRAAESNPPGEVLHWEAWSLADIPDACAIICRNNAPLFSLAFALLRKGRGVQMLGTDIGKALESSLKKATKKLAATADTPTMRAALSQYFNSEIAKAKTPVRAERLRDRWDCLNAIVDEAGTLTRASVLCHSLFENKDATIILSSGHKSKGLEWGTVIHLNPELIPSKWAHDPETLTQEYNIRYVIETRARFTLILASTGDLL